MLGFSFSAMSLNISSDSPSPEWVYVNGEYYWDGNDQDIWDYDNGIHWKWDRQTDTWTFVEYI